MSVEQHTVSPAGGPTKSEQSHQTKLNSKHTWRCKKNDVRRWKPNHTFLERKRRTRKSSCSCRPPERSCRRLCSAALVTHNLLQPSWPHVLLRSWQNPKWSVSWTSLKWFQCVLFQKTRDDVFFSFTEDFPLFGSGPGCFLKAVIFQHAASQCGACVYSCRKVLMTCGSTDVFLVGEAIRTQKNTGKPPAPWQAGKLQCHWDKLAFLRHHPHTSGKGLMRKKHE